MARQRKNSNLSMDDDHTATEQELGSMYDYLAKIILLGPSGSGKSCLLHRFVKNEWRFVSSQTIGVEFASKIVKIGTGARRKRVKLQLWDTAGTERFRSVSRSYYRGAAGALLVYDVSSHNTFTALPTFLHDARALASPQLSLLLAGNKVDLADGSVPQSAPSIASTSLPDTASLSSSIRPSTAQSSSTVVDAQSSTDGGGAASARGGADSSNNSIRAPSVIGLGTRNTATVAFDGREVTAHEAAAWAASQNIAVSVEVSALSGDGVDELFARLARMILTKIELGEIDPDDPQSGIQYGDGGRWAGASDAGSIKSQSTVRRRKGRGRAGTNGWMTGMREWEEVFRIDGGPGRRRRCC